MVRFDGSCRQQTAASPNSGLLVLVLLYLGWGHFSGKRAYQAWATKARAAGERLTIQEVKELFVVPEGFDVLSEADMSALLEPCDSDLPCVEPMWVIEDETRVASWKAGTWREREDNPRPWSELRDGCAKNLAAIEPVVARLDAGPFVVQPRLDWESDLKIFSLINAIRHFQARAVLGLHDGQPDEAAAWLLRSLRLQRTTAGQATLIGQIGHLTLGAINFPTTWAVLEGARWTDEELAKIDAAWEEARFAQALLDGLQGERALSLGLFPGGELEAYADARGGMLGIIFSGSGQSRSPSPARGLFGRVAATLQALPPRAHHVAWRMAWADADKLAYAKAIQTSIDSLRVISRDRHGASAPPPGIPFGTPPSALERITRVVSVTIIPKVWQIAADSAMAETRRDLIRAAIALKRFKLRHGAFPASLDELVPDLLEELPWDWQAGKPLTYRRRDDGTFLLYSWGENQVDDGGDPGGGAWPRGPDLVWLPASPPDSGQ